MSMLSARMLRRYAARPPELTITDPSRDMKERSMSCCPTKITSVTRASRFSRLLIARMTPATDITRGSLKGWTIS